MNANTLIAIALAALLVFAGGAAALPGNAPDGTGADAADDRQPDDPADEADGNATETEDDGIETTSDDARDVGESDGPPSELPEQAPDRVGEIHDLIRSLSGHELGHALSGLLGRSDRAQTDAADAGTEHASETGDDASTDAESAGPPSSLPEQAADRVSGIHDAILSFLSGDGDGDPGDAVSTAAQG